MSGIGVITNPRSRVNKKNPAQMQKLAYLLGSRGSAEATRSIDDLYRAAEEFKSAGIDILGINGGDGTIHVTLTAFMKVYGDTPLPKIAILRGGTLNTIAAGLGIRGTTQELLYSVIDRYHQGDDLACVQANVMQIGDKFGFIFGNGVVANFLGAYYATGKPSPIMGAKLLMRTVGSTMLGTSFAKNLFQRFHGQVTVDGEAWARTDFVTILAATVPEIGLGFAPLYRCNEKPCHFAILGIHCSPASLVLEMLRIWHSRPMRRDKAISTVCASTLIESEEPFSYTIDGDIYHGAQSLVLKTGPMVQLIVPEARSPVYLNAHEHVLPP